MIKFLPETVPYQNHRHSHLRCPTPNVTRTEEQHPLCSIQPRSRHSRIFRNFDDQHELCHTVTCYVRTSRAPWYSTNTQQCNTCCIIQNWDSIRWEYPSFPWSTWSWKSLIQQVITAFTKNKLTPQRIVLPDNLQEKYARLSRTSSQRTEKSHQFIWIISKNK